MAVDLPARSFNLARPGVAPPLPILHLLAAIVRTDRQGHLKSMISISSKTAYAISFY